VVTYVTLSDSLLIHFFISTTLCPYQYGKCIYFSLTDLFDMLVGITPGSRWDHHELG